MTDPSLRAEEHDRAQDGHWHSHEYWELVYCTGGEGAYHLESGATLHYRGGQAAAIPPEEVHRNAAGRSAGLIHLAIRAPAFPYKTAFVVQDNAEGHMGVAFALARSSCAASLRDREPVLTALAELIGSYMIALRDSREFSTVVERIRTAILENYTSPSFELDREIREMPFHYDYLRKLFQKEMGLTPLKYMIDLRMKRARSMLAAARTREYTVAEVAERCGFSDALYFSRVFKKYYGCSPSEFVKQRRGEGAV